jgi:hypothetical protein
MESASNTRGALNDVLKPTVPLCLHCSGLGAYLEAAQACTCRCRRLPSPRDASEPDTTALLEKMREYRGSQKFLCNTYDVAVLNHHIQVRTESARMRLLRQYGVQAHETGTKSTASQQKLFLLILFIFYLMFNASCFASHISYQPFLSDLLGRYSKIPMLRYREVVSMRRRYP